MTLTPFGPCHKFRCVDIFYNNSEFSWYDKKEQVWPGDLKRSPRISNTQKEEYNRHLYYGLA